MSERLDVRGAYAAAGAAAAAAFLDDAAGFLVTFLAAGLGAAAFLVTRPDLVLPRTTGFSTTAGAWGLCVSMLE